MTGKKVVGVSYGEDGGVPLVVLKGAHDEAEAILAAARARDVPVVRSAALVDGLYRTPIDAPVDKALFPVMAALLAHVVAVDQRLAEENR